MTRDEAEKKRIETVKLNPGMRFKLVWVTYKNGEEGWDVTSAEEPR
jgi:hypothetical protein